MMDDWIVSIDHVTAQFGTTFAFREISFDIPRHCIFGVFGATGCGKSTLAQSLAGFAPKNSLHGQIFFKEAQGVLHSLLDSHTNWSLLHGRKIVYVPQDTYKNLNPYETIFQQLERIISQYQSVDLEDVLKMVELPQQILHHFPHTLSAGQRQRCALACALATQAELLILDEPMSAMDHAGRIHLIETLQQYSQSHTVLLISHENPQYHAMIPRDHRFYFPTIDLPDSTEKSTPRLPTLLLNRQSTPRLPTVAFAEQVNPNSLLKTPPSPINHGENLLQISNLTKIWDGYLVFDHLNFAMKKGDWIYLEGYNGCGKTTFLNILLGIVSPEDGEFQWENSLISWKKIRAHSQRYIHTVFQNVYNSFDPRLTIQETFSEISQRIPPHDRWEIENYSQRLWDDFELPIRLKYLLPNQLSYGQQKRVAILRCLLEYRRSQRVDGGHHLLILDESLSGIHRELRKKMIDILFEYKSQNNFSMIWVAHEDIALKDICNGRFCLSMDG